MNVHVNIKGALRRGHVITYAALVVCRRVHFLMPLQCFSALRHMITRSAFETAAGATIDTRAGAGAPRVPATGGRLDVGFDGDGSGGG